MNRRSPVILAGKAALLGALLLPAPFARAEATPVVETGLDAAPAPASHFALKVEPGLALPLTDPQSQAFKVGGGQTIKALWGLTPYLDVGPSATFMALPSEGPPGDAGTAWGFGGGVRVKRPHDVPGGALAAVSPWLDADALYIRTGALNRPGFAAAAGVSIPIGESRSFWIGPFARYLHVMQGERAGFDNRDAKVVSLGVSLEVGTGRRRERRAVAVAPEVRTVIVNKETFLCPDRDKDQIPDEVDRCPDVAGSMDSWGCPAYEKIAIQRDKLELKEKLYFAWNQASLQEISFPVLDEVVHALNDNKGFRVQIEGHSSSEGGDGRNQALSEQRAAAVLDYLASHGIEKDRLDSKGLSSSVPIDTNTTVAGRENNRRVEFVVHFIIVNKGSK